MRKVFKAIRQAQADAASSMTERLRSSAIASGWDAEVASNISLDHDGKSFSLNIHPDYKARAFDHEFGTETTPPKAVLRKHLMNTSEFDQIMGKHLHTRWDGKK